jgi:hypothetical protein
MSPIIYRRKTILGIVHEEVGRQSQTALSLGPSAIAAGGSALAGTSSSAAPAIPTREEFQILLKTLTKNRKHLEQIHTLYYRAFNLDGPNLCGYENGILTLFDTLNHRFGQNAGLFRNNSFLLYQFLRRLRYQVSKADLLISHYQPHADMKLAFKQLGWTMYDYDYDVTFRSV